MKLFRKKSSIEKVLPWMDVSEASTTAAVYICIDPLFPPLPKETFAYIDLSRFAQSLGLSIGENSVFFDHCKRDTPLIERPGFLQMIRACREADRPFDLILVDHSTHLTKIPDDLVFLYSLLIQWFGVALLFREQIIESKRLYFLDHSFADPSYVTGTHFGFDLPETRPVHPIEHSYIRV